MSIYVAVLLIMGFPALTSRTKEINRDKIQFIISFLALSLLLVLRSNNVGSDTTSYITIYNNLYSMTWSEALDTNYEPLYVIVNKFFGMFNLSARTFTNLFILTILLLFFIGLYKYSDNFNVALLIFVCLCFNQVYLMRQSMAVAIIFVAFKYAKERKFFRYLIAVIIASGFHITGFIGILVYFFYPIKSDKIMLVLTTLLCFIMVVFPKQIIVLLKSILKMLHINMDSYLIEGEMVINFIMILLGTIVFIYLTLGRHDKLFNLAFLAVCGQLLAPVLSIATRVSSIFWPYICLLISTGWTSVVNMDNRFEYICKEKNLRKELFMIFFAFYIFFWFYAMLKGSKIGGYFIPYEFFWEVTI